MVRVIFGGQVFCQVVNLCLYWGKDLLSENPLCIYNPGYATDSIVWEIFIQAGCKIYSLCYY